MALLMVHSDEESPSLLRAEEQSEEDQPADAITCRVPKMLGMATVLAVLLATAVTLKHGFALKKASLDSSAQEFSFFHNATVKNCVDNVELHPENSMAWVNLSAAGGGRVNGKEYSVKACLGKALELDPENINAWMWLSTAGGGQVKGKAYFPKACLVKALELHPENTVAWTSLGMIGGGQVKGKEYSDKACYVKALELDPENPVGWFWLGMVGGGQVKGEEYSRKACDHKAEKFGLRLKERNQQLLNSTHKSSSPTYWYSACSGGHIPWDARQNIGGKPDAFQTKCKTGYVKALELDPEYYAAWTALGAFGGGQVKGKEYSQKACFVKALELDPENSVANMANIMFCACGQDGPELKGCGPEVKYAKSGMLCMVKALERDPLMMVELNRPLLDGERLCRQHVSDEECLKQFLANATRALELENKKHPQ